MYLFVCVQVIVCIYVVVDLVDCVCVVVVVEVCDVFIVDIVECVGVDLLCYGVCFFCWDIG